MADAALSPGKRLRPLATLAAGDLVRAPRKAVMPVAVSVELVHAASLVLDDLPSMDDAARRRGRPALHRVHGVATSELAAVALLARAFELPACDRELSAAARSRIVAELAGAVGAEGCCAGQAADLAADPAAVRSGRSRGDSRPQDRGPLRRGGARGRDRRRGGRARPRRAHALRPEPGPRLPDHRRSAGSRRGSGPDGEGRRPRRAPRQLRDRARPRVLPRPRRRAARQRRWPP